MILGIDVGGTTVKFGTVTPDGDVINKKAFDTVAWDISPEGFVKKLSKAIGEYVAKFPEINKVGIGLPGVLSNDRISVIDMANIQSAKDAPIVTIIENENPSLSVRIENDAKCATLGELTFGTHNQKDFLFVTLGTGVGSGLIIDGGLFLGARGNACEIGHVIIDGETTIEQKLGLNQIILYAQKQLADHPSISSSLRNKEITPKLIFDECIAGDKFALSVFEYVGDVLAKGLVSAIRLFDVNQIVLGGGVAGAFDFFYPQLITSLEKYLIPYYTKDLGIYKASVKGEAGILGAAALQSAEFKIVGKELTL